MPTATKTATHYIVISESALLALYALNVSIDGYLWATNKRQSSHNLNATVARALAIKGLIQAAPEWMAPAGTGHGRAWLLTDLGLEEIRKRPGLSGGANDRRSVLAAELNGGAA